jgi:cysteine desulfurase
MNRVYLDHAAATPLDDDVRMRMASVENIFHNPSAVYEAGRDARRVLEEARADVAACLGTRPSEIVFTRGGTESINMAIKGVLGRYPHATVVTSAIEHAAVMESVPIDRRLILGVSLKGVIDLAKLPELLSDNVVLVSVMLANNEIGSIQPVHDVVELVKKIRLDRRARGVELPLYVHTDACQATNYMNISLSRLGVDLLSLNGSKMYGPKSAGVLFARRGIVLEPLVNGGGQEWGLRSGTEDIQGAVGIACALQRAQKKRESEVRRLSAIRDTFIRDFLENITHATVNGHATKRLANNIHVTIPGCDNETLIMQLDALGFEVAAGSACHAASDEPSHVLKAIGLSDEQARSSIRITLGRSTTNEQLHDLLKALCQLVIVAS